MSAVSLPVIVPAANASQGAFWRNLVEAQLRAQNLAADAVAMPAPLEVLLSQEIGS